MQMKNADFLHCARIWELQIILLALRGCWLESSWSGFGSAKSLRLSNLPEEIQHCLILFNGFGSDRANYIVPRCPNGILASGLADNGSWKSFTNASCHNGKHAYAPHRTAIVLPCHRCVAVRNDFWRWSRVAKALWSFMELYGALWSFLDKALRTSNVVIPRDCFRVACASVLTQSESETFTAKNLNNLNTSQYLHRSHRSHRRLHLSPIPQPP